MRIVPLVPLAGALLVSVGCADGGSDSPPGGHSGGHSGGAVDNEEEGAPGPRSVGEPEVLATGLDVPWGMDFLPDGAAVVTERDSARLLRVEPDGSTVELTAVDDAEPEGEAGLLGVAVSPEFVSDAMLYLYYTTDEDNRVVRMTYEPNAPGEDNAELGEPEVVLSGIPRDTADNGGQLAFGPDGMLYAGTGDAGEPELAQDTDALSGKVLRMTPEGEPVQNNPFDNHVYSYGHRNVQGLAWDDDELYAAEFGPDGADEINRIAAGENYGWPEVTGVANREEFTDPVMAWTEADGATPAGGAVAGGTLWSAALHGEAIWGVPLAGLNGAAAEAEELGAEAKFVGEYGRLRAVVPTPERDALWVTTSNQDGHGEPGQDDDRILRVPLD